MFWIFPPACRDSSPLELNSFVSCSALAQQTFLAGEIAQIRSWLCFRWLCFTLLLLLPCSLCSSCSQLPALLDLYNLQRRRKSFHFHLSSFLHFFISPFPLTPPLFSPLLFALPLLATAFFSLPAYSSLPLFLLSPP